MIKYHYAFDDNNNIVSINDINKENRHQRKYYCINCGSEMIPKLGKHNAHHFAHLSDAECKGGFESYVHELAKNLFLQRFNQPKSLLLQYEIKEKCCCIDDCKVEVDKEAECCHMVSKQLDVKKHYDIATLEKGFDNYRADILLEDSSGNIKPLMIEIFVSHQCSEEKQHSGNPIFEIPVETEEDAWKLCNEKIIQGGVTYNFNQNKFRSDICLGIDLPMNTFILYQNGKSWITRKPKKCNELMKPFYPKSYLEFSYRESAYEISSLLLKAKELGFNIKDCAICSNYKLTNGWSPSWVCWLYKKEKTPHYPDTRCAYGCPLYCENSMVEKMKECPVILNSSPEVFNQMDFSFVYKAQMEREKNEREELLKRQEEEQQRREDRRAFELKEQEKQNNAEHLRFLNWFSAHFKHNTFKLVCHKDEVPLGFFSKSTEFFEGDLVHLDFKPRFDEQKILLSKYAIELSNRNNPTLPHLYINIIYSGKVEPVNILKNTAMVIYVFVNNDKQLSYFWEISYAKFSEYASCIIFNKEKIIKELVAYNYK